MVAFAWMGLTAVVGSLVLIVDAALPGGPRLPGHSYLLPFVLAVVTFVGILFLVSDGRFGRVRFRRLWGALLAVPLPAALGVLAMLVVLLLHRLVRNSTVVDDYASNGFVEGSLYFGVLATAVAYGQHRLESRSGPPPSIRAHVAVYSLCAAVMVAFGVTNVSTTPVLDNQALHRDVASRFANAPWVSHLVAANFEHGAYVYHFDTRDEAILSAACLSLVPYDEASSGPGFASFPPEPTSLHYYNHGTDIFIRLCPPSAAPPPIAHSASPTASTLAELRTRLLEPPPGATRLGADGGFTFGTIPTDLVWETVNRAGFVRGVTRQWQESDGTLVDIVIFQFTDVDAASFFASAADAVLIDGRFGCHGWVPLAGPAHGQVFGCNATSPPDHDSWRAEMYLSVYAASVVVIPPGPRGTSPLTGPAEQQGQLLA